MGQNSLISIIVPFYNEQENLRVLCRAIREEMEPLFQDFEILLIDDGSTDQSAEVAGELHLEDRRVKLLSLSRNFGKQRAVFAGLEHVNGAAAVVMDADLQHPPAVIPELISSWKHGHEVVFAVPRKTPGDLRPCSNLFARLFTWSVRLPRTPHASDFVLIDRVVVQQLQQVRERNRFFRYLVAWSGFRQTAIPYVPAKRHAGTTKFKPRELAALAVDALTSFTSSPLRLCTLIGFAIALACIPYTLWAIYERLFTSSYVPGWSALMVAVLFLGAVQLISLGILGEYIGRIYDEVKGRPLYILRDRIGFETRGDWGAAQRREALAESSVTNGPVAMECR